MKLEEALEKALARFPYENVRDHMRAKPKYWKQLPTDEQIADRLRQAFEYAKDAPEIHQPAWDGILFVGVYDNHIDVGFRGIGSRVYADDGSWKIQRGPSLKLRENLN